MLEKLEESAKQILNAGLIAANAGELVERDLSLKNSILSCRDFNINLKKHKKIYVIGAGKAAIPMADSVSRILGDKLTEGIVITKEVFGREIDKIEVIRGGHPIVSKESLQATNKIIKLIKKIKAEDFVIVLISGGGSALLEKFPRGVSLNDAQKLNELLIKSGINIKRINKVRRNISLIKNGGLGELLSPAKVMTLILSDVISDRMDLIASGPTISSGSKVFEAIDILKLNKIWRKTPKRIRDHLLKKADEEKEKGRKKRAPLPHVTNILLGSNNDLLIAARDRAEKGGYNTMILTSQAQGEAKDIAKLIGSVVNEIVHFDRPIKKPACLITGGETTVTVTGDGIGGRNLEFCLSAAINIRHLDHNVLIASVGTDGGDGNTPVAAPMVTQYTFDKAMSILVNPREYLENNDSYTFFEQVGGLLNTGPTGTNVMDIILVLVQ